MGRSTCQECIQSGQAGGPESDLKIEDSHRRLLYRSEDNKMRGIEFYFGFICFFVIDLGHSYVLHKNLIAPRNWFPLLAKATRTTPHQHETLDDDARKEALSGVLYQIERAYGRGSIQKLGETPRMTVETTSSGSMTLDIALGGGYPKGRVIEIYGPESSGKTTLALHAIAEVQAGGGSAAFVDAEHALDPVYARNLGVDVDNLLVCQPDSGEMALDVVDQLVRSSALDMVVIDSVAALVPRAELEGDMTDQQMGLQARLMSKALRKITGSLSKSKTAVIFINQLRSKIGVMYGNPEVTAGGNALKFYSSVRVDIRRREVLKENQGIMAKVKVVKNKVAPPFRTVEFDILFGSGIDKYGCLLDAAEALEIVDRKGSWYSRGDVKLAQGRRPTIEHIKSNLELAAEIEKEVRDALQEKLPNVKEVAAFALGDAE
jgi:recombination protein RecA